MAKATELMRGKRDFRAFMASGSAVTDTVRDLFALSIEESECVEFLGMRLEGGILRVRAEADGFLRHMVRNMVGTLVEVGKGGMRPRAVLDILEGRDRRMAGRTAPARGLFLEEVIYGPGAVPPCGRH
jgi:tRNA pseudouridine38-40 synthase